jgi:homoserine kinase
MRRRGAPKARFGGRAPGDLAAKRAAAGARPRERVVIRVPATTANLGPGFDALGLSLTMYNRLEVQRLPEGGEVRLEIETSGDGADRLPADETNLAFRAFRRVFEKLDTPVPPVRMVSEIQIPLSRGLGSSAAAVVGGLIAGNELAGRLLSGEELLCLGTAMEGHPDNVAPALFGGFTAACLTEDGVAWARLEPPPGLRAVLVIPEREVPTAQARAVLPDMVPRRDAVLNVGRTALLVAAFATGELGLLRSAMEDRLHEPYRAVLIPGMPEALAAAREAGALGAALSGAGSTLLALATDRFESIGAAMRAALAAAGLESRVLILSPDAAGASVESTDVSP